MRALGLIVLAAAALSSACGTIAASPGSDSYNRIEELRTNRSMAADNSYDRIEQLRVERSAAALDDSYDRLEAHRLTRGN